MRNGLIIFQMLRRESNYINMMKNNEYYSSPEMEIVELPGGRLPKLPTAAKRCIRAFDPESDEPFPYDPTQKIPEIGWESD